MSARHAKKHAIAVMAGPELVGALRLAGVRETCVVEGEQGSPAKINETLRGWIAGGEVGVILIAEEPAAHAAEVIRSVRARKGLVPVILEIPDGALEKGGAAAFYRKMSRDFLGLEIVLKEDAPDADGDESEPRQEM